MKKTLLFVLAVFAGQHVCADQIITLGSKDTIQQQAFEYLNDLRMQAGMIPFTYNETLQNAAQAHADYLFLYRQWGHDQHPGKQGFTGRTPQKRMLKAGYSSRHNSENVSSHTGKATPVKSINGLMSAIYHRFGFLSFEYNEVGIGSTTDGRFHSYVYDMGNSIKAELCSTPEAENLNGQYVFKVCANETHKIPSGVFDRAVKTVQLKNTHTVVWPHDGASNVPPGFYDEAPDPLPHHDVSGYPVSLQFNPVFFKDNVPNVTRFELIRVADNRKVKIIARFDHQNDINQKFTEYEHAIFPLNRLEWDTAYRVEVDYVTPDNRQHQLQWQFKTTGFDVPLYKVQGGEVISEKQAAFVVYSPPLSQKDAKSEYQVSFRGFEDVEVAILDAHTLMISPKGRHGQAMFDFHGRQFQVIR